MGATEPEKALGGSAIKPVGWDRYKANFLSIPSSSCRIGQNDAAGFMKILLHH